MANAVEGAQLVAIAHAGSHELRLTERGPVEVHHEVGFIDAMTSSEVSLATGLGQWAAGRKVGLAEALAGRFTKLLGKVLTGELATVNAGKVVAACDGLDPAACAAVEDVLVERVVGMDPARITTVARRVATRIAADQVAAATAKNRKDRAVQVTRDLEQLLRAHPGPLRGQLLTDRGGLGAQRGDPVPELAGRHTSSYSNTRTNPRVVHSQFG